MRRTRMLLIDLAHAAVLAVLVAVCASMFWALAPLAVGLRSSVIMSGSMTPCIQPGDVVVSVPISVEDLQPGMVISFTDPADPKRTLVHRLSSANADGTVTTRGDANSQADSTPLPVDLIHGQTRIRIPYAGLPLYWLNARAYSSLAAVAMVFAAAVVLAAGSRLPQDDRAESTTNMGRHRAAPGRRRRESKASTHAGRCTPVRAGSHRRKSDVLSGMSPVLASPVGEPSPMEPPEFFSSDHALEERQVAS